MFFNTPSCLNSRPCAGRNLFKRIVSRFLVRMSIRFLLPSINQKLFLKCSMKWHYISTCFEHFSIFGPGLWIHIVLKEYRWVKQQCHAGPPSWSDKAILIFSSPLIWASTCTSIFSRNHIQNSLHQYHLCQQARAPCCWVLGRIHADWCGSEQYCVKKWGEQELDVLILVPLCMGIEMNVVAGRDPWILHMIGNSIRY